MSIEQHSWQTLLPYSDTRLVPLDGPKFRKIHYDRVVMRTEGTYPAPLHEIWLQAFHSFYQGSRDTQDRLFFQMAAENPSLALSALPGYAQLLNPSTIPAGAVLLVRDRDLYELVGLVVADSCISFAKMGGTVNPGMMDQQLPKWYLEWSSRRI